MTATRQHAHWRRRKDARGSLECHVTLLASQSGWRIIISPPVSHCTRHQSIFIGVTKSLWLYSFGVITNLVFACDSITTKAGIYQHQTFTFPSEHLHFLLLLRGAITAGEP